MKRSTERLISLVIALVLMLASLVVYFDYIQSTYSDVQDMRSQISSKNDFLNNQKQTIGQIQNVLKDYQSETGFQDKLSAILPLAPELASALGQLNGLAHYQSYSFPISSISYSSKGERLATSSAKLSKPLGTLEFKLRFTGRYEDLKSFLGYLENNLRLFDVQELNLSPVGDPKQDIYNIDLTVDTYYQAS